MDLNEFAKVEPGERLETYGVATCTVVGVTYPGRFAYLAHIAPNDAIYTKGKSSRPFARNGNSDFAGELIGKIEHYDVYPCELKNLQFTIVAQRPSCPCGRSQDRRSRLDSETLGRIWRLTYAMLFAGNPNARLPNRCCRR